MQKTESDHRPTRLPPLVIWLMNTWLLQVMHTTWKSSSELYRSKFHRASLHRMEGMEMNRNGCQRQAKTFTSFSQCYRQKKRDLSKYNAHSLRRGQQPVGGLSLGWPVMVVCLCIAGCTLVYDTRSLQLYKTPAIRWTVHRQMVSVLDDPVCFERHPEYSSA